jgi:hypothetical protein
MGELINQHWALFLAGLAFVVGVVMGPPDFYEDRVPVWARLVTGLIGGVVCFIVFDGGQAVVGWLFNYGGA